MIMYDNKWSYIYISMIPNMKKYMTKYMVINDNEWK